MTGTMARDFDFGSILDGNRDALERSYQQFDALLVDQDWSDEVPAPRIGAPRTIANAVEVSAPGTFSKNQIRTLLKPKK